MNDTLTVYAVVLQKQCNKMGLRNIRNILSENVFFTLRGYCTRNLKLECFVLYLKIINMFVKNNTCILNLN